MISFRLIAHVLFCFTIVLQTLHVLAQAPDSCNTTAAASCGDCVGTSGCVWCTAAGGGQDTCVSGGWTGPSSVSCTSYFMTQCKIDGYLFGSTLNYMWLTVIGGVVLLVLIITIVLLAVLCCRRSRRKRNREGMKERNVSIDTGGSRSPRNRQGPTPGVYYRVGESQSKPVKSVGPGSGNAMLRALDHVAATESQTPADNRPAPKPPPVYEAAH